MIKEKNIEVNITNRNKTYYLNMGYDIKDIMNVKVEDLSKSSRLKITAICDICKSENIITYSKYLENHNRYNYYGCKSCSRSKAIKTNKELYSVEHYMQSDTAKKEYKEYCLDKYGVDNSFKDPVVQEKKNNTMIERYGSKCALMHEDVKQKSIKTNLELYGAESFNKSIYFKQKIHKNYIKFYKKKLPKDYDITDFKILTDNILKIKCNSCNKYYETTYKLLYQRTKLYSVEPCTICNGLDNKISWGEQELYNYVSTLTDTIQTAKILNGKDIDMYCENLNFGIEYNGIYWHSEKYKDKYYHHNKYVLSKMKNIKLFSVYENMWLNNKEMIKTLLYRFIKNEYKQINNYTIEKIKKTEFNIDIFDGVVSNNNYTLKIDNENIGYISYNNDNEITYFNFDINYASNDIFKIMIDELNLENYYYLHNNNNIFLNLNEYQFIKNEEPSYKYYNIKDKQTILHNKNTINQKYKNNFINILEDNYFKIYDNGSTTYKLSKINDIEDFLKNNDINYFHDNNALCFLTNSGRKFEIHYIDSFKYTTDNVDKKYFYNLSYKAEQNNSFIFWIKDFEWNDKTKQEILKSYILHAANKTVNKVYARDCEIKIVDNKTARSFEKENCFYGSRGASLNLGLVLKKNKGIFKKGDLLMLYTFGHNFFSKNKENIEVIRVGTVKYSMVVGGSSKLFKYFINNYNKFDIDQFENIKNIIFYSDYDHNIGGSMSNLNFNFENYSKGGIMNYWIHENKVKHRQPTKHKFIQEQIKNGSCLEIPNAGIKKYIYKL